MTENRRGTEAGHGPAIPSPQAGWTIGEWRRAAADGAAGLAHLLEHVQAWADADPAWIFRLPHEEIRRRLQDLARRPDAAALPLLGVPFAIKDNIDVAGLPTTAGCPQFSHLAPSTAPVVQKLLDAGAVLVGKTNLDQFATGLTGTRSPYGAVPNAFDPLYISGGSSAGSASVVARGLVPFALGTDTAGSGRVPAGCNNIVGLKPTRGRLSARGVLPACRSLDCVSIFALTVGDAALVAGLAAGPDRDAYSRSAPPGAAARRLPDKPRLGVPARPIWFGDEGAAGAFGAALAKLEKLGASIVPLDIEPMLAVAALLYQGPWVAERYAAVGEFIRTNPLAVHPVVRQIIEQAKNFDAESVFRAQYRLAELKADCDAILDGVDALLVPTTPTIYPISDVMKQPVELNSRLGTYTNFVNLLDWCALALPAGFRPDGLPAGITLIGLAWSDSALVEFGLRWESLLPGTLGATGRRWTPSAPAKPIADPAAVRIAVVGAHLAGMPLNHQLTSRRARLVEKAATSSDYRLFALAGTVPPKPGLVKTGDGAPIEVELWEMPVENFGTFVDLVDSPLAIGTLILLDGRSVKGFVCEAWAARGARDITEFGGWRAYVASAK